jgi:hypothetical protein
VNAGKSRRDGTIKSPARKCRVGQGKGSSPCRDGTMLRAGYSAIPSGNRAARPEIQPDLATSEHTSTQRAHRALKAHTSTQRAHRALKAHTSTQRAHRALKAHTSTPQPRPPRRRQDLFPAPSSSREVHSSQPTFVRLQGDPCCINLRRTPSR